MIYFAGLELKVNPHYVSFVKFESQTVGIFKVVSLIILNLVSENRTTIRNGKCINQVLYVMNINYQVVRRWVFNLALHSFITS